MRPASSEITSLLLPVRAELTRLGVRELLLFGSRARGDAAPDSDWDFVVDFSSAPDFDRFMGVRQVLEDHLGGRVDLLSRQACPPRLWRAIEPELVHAA
jgi:uncharacterized protein